MAFPITVDEFLRIWEQVLDPSYTGPMLLVGDDSGFEMYRAHAEMCARTSLAVDITTQALFILPSSIQTNPPAAGGAKATATLTVSRTASFQIELSFIAGRVAFTDEVGRQFVVTVDTVLAAGAVSVGVPVEAVRQGYSWNVLEEEVDEFVQPGKDFTNLGGTVTTTPVTGQLTDTGAPDHFIEPHIGQYLQFIAGSNLGSIRRIEDWTNNEDGTHTITLDNGATLIPEAGTAGWRILAWDTDLFLSVTNAADASGGRTGMLDVLGRGRRMIRQDGEEDEAYRLRIATLPDVVSPCAIVRAANRILAPLGEKVCLREVGTDALRGFFWDEDPWDNDFSVRPEQKFNVWFDFTDMRAFFLLGVPNRTDGEFGFFYDEGFVNAYDAAPALAFYDGFPAIYWLQTLGAIHDQVTKVKAGGVGFEIILNEADDPPCGDC